jgi:hypothetical protein
MVDDSVLIWIILYTFVFPCCFSLICINLSVYESVSSFAVINTKQYNYFYRLFSRKSRITAEIGTLLLAQVKLL